MVWLGLPQLLLIPFIPKVMQRIQPRMLVIIGFSLFSGGSLLAMHLSDDFSGPQFLGSSLVRALAQAMTMAPLSAIAIAGIAPELAGSASALFNATRNLGGAVGIALLQIILTKREQFHSNVLSSQATLLAAEVRVSPSTIQRCRCCTRCVTISACTARASAPSRCGLGNLRG
jgi:DHA2 family multidrug resistance protein